MPNINKIFVILIIVSFLSGCKEAYVSSDIYSKKEILPKTASIYLKEAQVKRGYEKEHYQLLAIFKLLSENKLDEAKELLKSISGDDKKPQKLILISKLLLKENKPKAAIQKLKEVRQLSDLKEFPNDMKIIYYSSLSEAYLRINQIEESVIYEIKLNALLNGAPLNLSIWHTLQMLPLKTLSSIKSQDDLVNGWINLAVISKKYANTRKDLFYSIQNWRNLYLKHSANTLFPSNISLKNNIKRPSQIALLLPLHGQFGKMGQAVQDGFMTAFYEDAKKLSKMPKVKTYDTSSEDLLFLYNKAILEGADCVIGPLTKDEVEKISKVHNIKVPTLALNYLDDKKKFKNLIQFGLSPEQAATQASTYAFQNGVYRIAIIAPKNKWGQDVKNAFVTKWNELGGQIAYSLDFSSRDELSNEISSMLNIDKSKQREQALEKLLHDKLKTISRRRQDINGIFLVGTPAQARQIRPLLKFYYAGDIPIFSVSTVYSGYNAPNDDRDFGGIYFNDMPWLLMNNRVINSLKKQVESLWPNNYKFNNRLFALGVDSYLLSVLFPRLQALPNFPIYGVTGQLYLEPNGQIYRQLLWARFDKQTGKPRLVN